MAVYTLDFDVWAARTMQRALKVAIERWSGGDAFEQENLHNLLMIFNTIVLEADLELDAKDRE